MTDRLIRLIVADDHRLFVAGIKAVFTGTNITVIDSTENPYTLLSLYELHKPDIVLCDIRFNDESRGIDVLKELLFFDNSAKVVMYSHFDDAISVLTAYQLGARAFLSKSISHHGLIKAIQKVSNGEVYIEASIALKLARFTLDSGVSKVSLSARKNQNRIASDNILEPSTNLNTVDTDVRSDEFRLLINRLDTALEAERKFIAMQLHDDIGASLVAIQFHINFLKSLLDENDALSPSVSTQLETVTTHLKRVHEITRNIGRNLRPEMLDVLGLTAALSSLINEYNSAGANTFKIYSSFEASDEDLAFLDSETDIIIYRIVQEGITNIIKHADASEVYIILEVESGHLILSISDNGIGFDTSRRPGTGLIGIREKTNSLNGELTIESNIDQGTTLTIKLPLPYPATELKTVR